jgi:hypothetical protein
MAKIKLQVSVDEEADAILQRLISKNMKSVFVNQAIKNFGKTKGAELFLRELETKEPEQAVEKTPTATKASKKLELSEWA